MLDVLYPSLATLAYSLLLSGFALRHRGALRHARFMGVGMALDISLVLTLEITRNAIATALGTLTIAQRIHIGSSALAITLYIPVFALGLVRLRNPTKATLSLKDWHRRLGFTALTLRTVGFLFMFSLVGHTPQ